MLKTRKCAVTLFAFSVVFLLAAPAASLAESVKLPESGQGKQIEPTKQGEKNTPKRAETHGHGTVITHNPNAGHLKGPEIRESGKGRLEGGEKQGEKNTPKRAPTQESKPS